jgi:ABC-type glycerol-3-phosphate transport system substrate-binding protein
MLKDVWTCLLPIPDATWTGAEEGSRMEVRIGGNRRTRAVIALVATVSAAALVAPVATVAQDPGKTVIAIPGWAFSLNPQIVVVAQQFSQENPELPPVELTLNPIAQETLDTSRYLLEASEQRSSFDAWFGMTPFIDLTNLVEGDVLEPWDDVMPQEIRDDIYPANVSEGTYTDGKLYSWPQVASAMLLAYRPSMLEAAGITEPPATWEDVIAAATAVESAMPGTYGIVFDTRTWRSLIPLAVSEANGTEGVFRDDGYLDLSGPAALASTELMVELGKHAPPDIFTPTGDMDVFKASGAAMLIKYVDAAGTAAKVFGQDDIAITTLPTPADDQSSVTVQWGTGFGRFKYGPNKDVATDFIAYLTNSELYQRGWIEAAQSTVYQSWQERLAADLPEWMAGQAEALASATFIPPTPNFVEWHTVVKPHIEAAIQGGTSAAEALSAAQAEVESTLGLGS